MKDLSRGMKISELCDRVFQGRASVLELGLGIDARTVKVVVSPTDYHSLESEYKEVWPHQPVRMERGRATVFGYDLEADPRLNPGEIRFVAEVAV